MSDDRTSEFFSIARTIPSSSGGKSDRVGGVSSASSKLSSINNNNINNSNSGSTPASASQSKSNSELRSFYTTASGISRDIAATSALLTELTDLVRHKSLFQEETQKDQQVNKLVVRIKTNMEGLNHRINVANQQLQAQKRMLGKNSQVGLATSNLVDGLKTEFAQAATGFKKVLQERTDHMKQDTNDFQRQVYGGGSGFADSEFEPIPNLSLAAPPPVYGGYDDGTQRNSMSVGGGGFPTLDLTSGITMSTGEATGSFLPRPHGIDGSANPYATPTASSFRNPLYSDNPGSVADTTIMTPWDIQQMEEESGMSQQMQLIPDQDYLRERADAMSTVESNIVELGTIFNKLAVMVSEHRDMVQRVEDNVEDANTNINLSLAALTDTLTNLQSNRGLMMRIVAILVVFIATFIIFFA